MNIEVDLDGCACAGRCVMAAPEVFDQREEDGRVILLEARPPERLHAAVRRAAQLCPAAVIKVID